MPPHSPTAKKGLGTAAKVGIGCGAIVALVVIGLVIASLMFGSKIVDFAEKAQKNPTRAAATMMVTASGGATQMVAEDDVNKRYTVKDSKTGELTTIYWDAQTNSPKVVTGSFSEIPATPGAER